MLLSHFQIFPLGDWYFFNGPQIRYVGAVLRLISAHPSTGPVNRNEIFIMQKINLRELYPDIYKKDTYLEVTDEVQAVFLADKRAEARYLR